MHRPRPTPFDLVFQPAAQTTFPTIRAALDRAGEDPRDRDRFLMLREVVTLLREMRPDEGLGEGIDRLAALVHHAYLFWDAGALTVEFPLGRLAELREPGSDENEAQGPPYYAQVPQRRIWADVVPGQPPEPMDGCFVYPIPESAALRVLGVFGLHPERLGFSVVEVKGPRPSAVARVDGSALFSPTLPGGAAAKLFSVAGEEELLDLAWRTHEVAIETSAEGARWRA